MLGRMIIAIIVAMFSLSIVVSGCGQFENDGSGTKTDEEIRMELVKESYLALEERITTLEKLLTKVEGGEGLYFIYYFDGRGTRYSLPAQYYDLAKIDQTQQLILDHLKLEYKPKEKCEKPAHLEAKEHVL